MRRFVGVMAGLGALILLTGAALAFMGPGASPMGMGAGMMGVGPHMMGGAAGTAGCPGMAAAGTATAPVTEEKAKELAQEYADKYLPEFTVDKVLPFMMGRGTGYSVQLKGPKEEVRTFHINPWGAVMPFGGPGRRGA